MYDYSYNVGDVILDLEILEKIKVKHGKNHTAGYKCKCLKDGNEFTVKQFNLKKGIRGCWVCSHYGAVKGVTDVYTTNPELLKYFLDEEDAKNITNNSSKKIETICPNCGNVREIRMNQLYKDGFSCPKCSDGISYPNKMMGKILDLLSVNYNSEVRFEWCIFESFLDKSVFNKGVYDFVLNDHSIIVEMDGGVHNIDTNYMSLEESKYKDKMKDILAKENGYDVVRIDCDYGAVQYRLNYIKNSILNSRISEFLDFSNVDFNKINNEIIGFSLVSKVAELWNDGMTLNEIRDTVSISKPVIVSYLQTMTEVGKCSYSVDECRKRSQNNKPSKYRYFVSSGETTKTFDVFSEMIRFCKEEHSINLNKNFINTRFKRNGKCEIDGLLITRERK